MDIRATLVCAAAFIALPAAAQQSEQFVIVIGSAIQQIPIEYTFVSSFDNTSIESYAWFTSTLVTMKNIGMGTSAMRDTRCVNAATDLRNVMSVSDVTDRWLAAQRVYSIVTNTTGAIRDIVLGTATNPLTGQTYKAFEITYADNGTEKWMINPQAAFSSMKLFDQPMPGSLKLGSGKVEPAMWHGLKLC